MFNNVICICCNCFILYFVEEKTYPVVNVEDFIQHVKTLHADTDDKFSQEFSVSHLYVNRASVW